MKKQRKTWKKRIFASLVAVCMVFTLLPATAMAAEGTEETPAQLVNGVIKAQDNPKTMESDKLEAYQTNMGMISGVDYDPDSGVITVAANRSGMVPYYSVGGGWKTYYALVMDFGDKTVMTDGESGKTYYLQASDGYGIENADIDDAKYFVPGYAEDEYKNPVVFWLNAAQDERSFILKYTEPAQEGGKAAVKTQNITVKMKDTSKLIDAVVPAAPESTAVVNPTENAFYKKNMSSITDVNASKLKTDGTITVTADRTQMEQYYREGDTTKKKYYALVMDFNKINENFNKAIAGKAELLQSKNIGAENGYEIAVSDYEGEAFKKQSTEGGEPQDPAAPAAETSSDSNSIVFWLNAEDDTRSFTLYKEITEKTESDADNPSPQVEGDAESGETSATVVARATQEITIKVVDSPNSITPTITLKKDKATVEKGQAVQLEKTITPKDADIDVTWESDDDEIAMVNSKGMVVGVEKGEATITATAKVRGGGQEAVATCDITVIDNNSSGTGGTTPGGTNPGVSGGSNGSYLPQNADIALNQDTALIYAKAKTQNTVQLKAVVVGNNRIVTWKSLNPRVATVKNGKVTAKKAGKATITATANGVTAKCVVTVKNPTIKLAKARATIKKGKKVRINATATPASKIKYKSNKKKVATVTAKGVVKGKKKGTAKITVTANGVKKTFTVKVK